MYRRGLLQMTRDVQILLGVAQHVDEIVTEAQYGATLGAALVEAHRPVADLDLATAQDHMMALYLH